MLNRIGGKPHLIGNSSAPILLRICNQHTIPTTGSTSSQGYCDWLALEHLVQTCLPSIHRSAPWPNSPADLFNSSAFWVCISAFFLYRFSFQWYQRQNSNKATEYPIGTDGRAADQRRQWKGSFQLAMAIPAQSCPAKSNDQQFYFPTSSNSPYVVLYGRNSNSPLGSAAVVKVKGICRRTSHDAGCR